MTNRDIIVLVAIVGGLYLMLKSINPIRAAIIQKMADAIQIFEGYYPGSIAYNNNNPGNLKWAGQPYAIDQDEFGHAIFDTYEHGWNALINQLNAIFQNKYPELYNTDMTIYDMFAMWATGNSFEYAQFVASKLGVSPDTQLKNLGV
jgi:hypothetical protein